jgi:Kef-type K+ transport system membrane component KefB
MLLYVFLLAAIVLIILVIVRLGSIALQFTGMEPGMAMFQSLSAFTNTGFTTKAAEEVVKHRKRRVIVSILMIVGHIGIVSVIVTLVHSFASETGSWLPVLRKLVFSLLGIYAAYFIFVFSPPGRRLGKKFARYREGKNKGEKE